jgi:hypothetical protein
LTIRIVLAEGLRAGVMLGVVAVVLGVLGLTPSLRWIPDVPLIVAAILVPVVCLSITGYRSGSRSGRIEAAGMAGAIAGAVGGIVGGIAYVLYGKSFLNIGVGLVLGTIGGAVIGAAGGLLARRYTLT